MNPDFSIHNLPFGIFSTKNKSPRVGVAFGDYVIDLAKMQKLGLLELPAKVLTNPFLNDFISLGKNITNGVRLRLQEMLSHSTFIIHASPFAIHQSKVTMHLPVKIGDYTDFYSSEEHATNVGKMFRPDQPLLSNWKQMPIAYHGRASSIVISGTPIYRPHGQILQDGNPIYSATQALDFELEMGMIIGKNSEQGKPISTSESSDYIFGFVLFNDWSARDIQRWEYQPLGPFLGKNFASSISPWVVTWEALAPFRVSSPKQAPTPLPYLQTNGLWNFDINLSVAINENVVCQTNFKNMYWNVAQQIAHHTINGCNLNIGDLLASGTISGSTPNSYGSLLELTWNGTKPLQLTDGSERKFLQDKDKVTMKGWAEKAGMRIGFGKVEGRIQE